VRYNRKLYNLTNAKPTNFGGNANINWASFLVAFPILLRYATSETQRVFVYLSLFNTTV